MDINLLKQQAAEAAKKGLVKDQSEETGGEFEYEPPAKGVCVARLISYVEVGKHKKKNDKFNKGAQPYAIIQFELLGKKHAKEIEVDGVKKTVYPIITERINISGSKKSWFYKMMHALDYGRGNTHMAFMVGEGFKINVLHNETEKDGKKVVYANIRNDSGWTISAPRREVEDDDGELKLVDLKVPQATVSERIFLWDAPSKEQWESIFIDGYREFERDGKKEQISKNWMQNQITDAENWGGSAMEALLAEIGGDLPDMSGDPAAESDEDGDLEDEKPSGAGKKGGASKGGSGAPKGNDDSDPLAGLDLEEDIDDEIPF